MLLAFPDPNKDDINNISKRGAYGQQLLVLYINY
jgi:hypothetical protein